MEEIKKDPTDSENRKLINVLKEIENKKEWTRIDRLKMTVNAPQCPVVYGLPKIHKEGTPLRLIFSFCGSPTYLVSKLLAGILQPVYGKTKSHIKDSGQICDDLRQLKLNDDEVLVSYDVVNLFGSVPAEEAAKMAIRRLMEDRNLKERTSLSLESCEHLMEVCIKSSYFKCNGKFYRIPSCPIGSPLSPGLCSIFMEEFEKKVLFGSVQLVRLWRRFVDDSLAVVRRGSEDEVLEHLNDGHEKIKFTYEKEEGGKIGFLDVEIRREGEVVQTKVFRKKTATERYLDFKSAHCQSVKWGVVSCLRSRAEKMCSTPKDLKEEIAYLRKVFMRNGYPVNEVRRKLSDTTKRRRDGKDQKDEMFLRISMCRRWRRR